jgi:2-dehydro-3-deoxy-D-arabinonate dehydratase
MSKPTLVRFIHPDCGAGPRVGLLTDDAVYDLTLSFAWVTMWLRASVNRVSEAIEDLQKAKEQAKRSFPLSAFEAAPAKGAAYLLAPVDTQEVWAAGVTYERSREARQQESVDGGDVYARVYAAERPEIFFKALGWRVIGTRGEVGVRSDATWSVPEPELVVVYNPAMQPVGFTVGNDVSSRDIEGANPLYLPQAKVYTASCALGPGIVLGSGEEWPDGSIHMIIRRGDAAAFEGEVSMSRIRRKINELGSYLGRSNHFPDGVALLTGTGIVPPAEFTLSAGDVVEINIDGIGTLVNSVKTV